MGPQFPPRTVERVSDTIREVFLSATAKDLVKYRQSVQEALRRIKADVVLQEEWTGPANDVIAICLKRLAESDAYFGIFGFRYGWVPDGCVKSITEMEYDHAVTLWQRTAHAPIFLFVPEAGSVAAKQLSTRADSALEAEYATDEKRKQSRALQQEFCQRLSSGRFVRSFKSRANLREMAIATVANFNGEILQNAVAGRRVNLAEIPTDALGSLGRKMQTDAITAWQSALEMSGAPGMCLVVHGSEQMGQLAFLKHLVSWEGWGFDDGSATVVVPPHDEFDEVSLRVAIARTIKPKNSTPNVTFEELAQMVVGECSRRPVVLLLMRLGAGGLQAFRENFWAPLLAELEKQWPSPAPNHRLAVIVTLYAPLDQTPVIRVTGDLPGEDPSDYHAILALPELGKFRSIDVLTWLREQGVNDSELRKKIAQRVTKDGIPRDVFDRLQTDGFWSMIGL
jgi:hypothetical protein